MIKVLKMFKFKNSSCLNKLLNIIVLTAIILITVVLFSGCGKSPSQTGVYTGETKEVSSWVHDWDLSDTEIDQEVIRIPTKVELRMSYFPDENKVRVYLGGDWVYVDLFMETVETSVDVYKKTKGVTYKFTYNWLHKLEIKEIRN